MMSRCTWCRQVHAGVEGAAPQNSLLTDEEDDEESVSMRDGGSTLSFHVKVELPESIARGMSLKQ